MTSTSPLYRTIREQIANQIRVDILTHRIPVGESLREQALAKRFGVSRGPIRDALLQLTQEGLLVARPNCGVKVGPPPAAEIQALVIDLRRRIETYALELGWKNITEEKLEELNHLADGLKNAWERKDLGGVIEHDIAFHRRLVELAGQPDLVTIWAPIVGRMMLKYDVDRDWSASGVEHHEIVDAMKRGDKKRALELLEDNIK